MSRRSPEKLLLLLLLLLQLNSAQWLQQQSKTNPTVKIGLMKEQQQPKIQRVVVLRQTCLHLHAINRLIKEKTEQLPCYRCSTSQAYSGSSSLTQIFPNSILQSNFVNFINGSSSYSPVSKLKRQSWHGQTITKPSNVPPEKPQP